MRFLHVFTEEPSAKIVFEQILPQILPEDVIFYVYQHQGKQDLESALRKTLPSISKIPGSKILVTRDQDAGDCIDVKKRLREIIGDNCSCEFYIRVVCRELESWFLGDLDAIQSAYPRFQADQYRGKAEYRNVDKITSPSNLLLKIIPEFSKREHLPKLETSEAISQYLNIANNSSQSFRYTIDAIQKLIPLE